jgi:hypothetical protein
MLAGSLLAKACGAEPVEAGTNIFAIEGSRVRFHTVNNGKTNFSINPATEPPAVIVAVAEKKSGDGVLRYTLRGVARKDCLGKGRTLSGGKTRSRLVLSLSMVERDTVRLGQAHLPTNYLEAPSVGDRIDLMSDIAKLAPEAVVNIFDSATLERIHHFVQNVASEESTNSATAN